MCSVCQAYNSIRSKVSVEACKQSLMPALDVIARLSEDPEAQSPMVRLDRLDKEAIKKDRRQIWPTASGYQVYAEECFIWHHTEGRWHTDEVRPRSDTTKWSTPNPENWRWLPATAETEALARDNKQRGQRLNNPSVKSVSRCTCA